MLVQIQQINIFIRKYALFYINYVIKKLIHFFKNIIKIYSKINLNLSLINEQIININYFMKKKLVYSKHKCYLEKISFMKFH